MSAQGSPAWLAEGATVAITRRGAYTGRDGDVTLHAVTRVGKATCTLSTGDKYSVRTLGRDDRDDAVTIEKLADPNDPIILATLQRQERDKARGRIRQAYDAFQMYSSPENTQALMDHLTAYQGLNTN